MASGVATVVKGQRSRRVMVSVGVMLAVGPRSVLRRVTMAGRKVARKVFWARVEMVV